MKIYTKTGDAGETSLLGGKRVSKSCVEMQVIGEVDELNAALGVVVATLRQNSKNDTKSFLEFIQHIQRDLFKVGAELAALQGPLEGSVQKIDGSRVQEMEVFIDAFWASLPELRNFILPGGSLSGAELHRARTVCRRVERQLVGFATTVPVRSELTVYLNRLSDFLFAAARYINAQDGAEEIIV
ncbi:MAG: cob(I)yrinic acid a,c-diamide adenosyltransferase [Candidatus Magasanikbacteria bacterium]|nr:cob(I)yrinic acid a,c-diamide adenosyltransferase [Candidatus Magasanikbacteria bacterium]